MGKIATQKTYNKEKCNNVMQQRICIKECASNHLEANRIIIFSALVGMMNTHILNLSIFLQGTLQTVCAKNEKDCDRL